MLAGAEVAELASPYIRYYVSSALPLATPRRPVRWRPLGHRE
jgi:hypothetical protein